MCEERWQEISNRLRVQATLIEVRGIIMELDFHKEVMQKLAEQACRSADLVNPIPY